MTEPEQSASNVEVQKLQLERDRLSFEIRKFEAEQPRRDRENAKLDQEIRQLGHAWYQNPAFLTPIATIVVAIVAGLIAFGTDVFKSNVFSLRQERNGLVKQAAQLNSQVQDLNTQKTKLSGENSSLRSDEAKLQSSVSVLTAKTQSLSREIPLTELKTHLQLLQGTGGVQLGTEGSLQHVLNIAQERQKDNQVIQVLLGAYQDPKSSPELKAALCLALLKATNDVQWKVRLREISIDGVAQLLRSQNGYDIDGSLYFDLLREPSVFNTDEKVQTLRQMYAIVREMGYGTGPTPSVSMRDDPLYVIAQWDEDATVRYRDPWFDYLARLYELREWENSYSPFGSNLLSFAPEAFGILVLRSAAEPSGTLSLRSTASFVTPTYPTAPGDREISTGLMGGNGDCPYFPATFPLCQDWGKPLPPKPETELSLPAVSLPGSKFTVLTSSVPAYKKWLDENQELAQAWTDPAFTTLHNCPDDAMRRIFRRWWVELSDMQREARR